MTKEEIITYSVIAIIIIVLGVGFIRAARKSRLDRKKNNFYENDEYCPACKKETTHKVFSAGHERDSSNDFIQCKDCGYIKYF